MPSRFCRTIGPALLITPLALLAVGCGGDKGGDLNSPDEPETGTVKVSATTDGSLPSTISFTVRLDGAAARDLPTNGSTVFSEVEVGDHTVDLSDLPEGCSSDEDTRTVKVTAGAQASAAFSVTCSDNGGNGAGGDDSTGTAIVTTRTTGENPDTDGYTLVVNGQEAAELESNGSVVLSGVTPSGSQPYAVTLGRVADNCAISGQATQQVSVAAGDTVQVTFDVECTSDTGGQPGSAPTVSILSSPTVVTTQPGDTSAVTFQYADPDADLTTAVLTIVSDPSGIYGATGDSTEIDITEVVQGTSEGALSYGLGCADASAPCPLAGHQDEVTLGLTLVDAAGHRSERAEFTFDVFDGGMSGRVSRPGTGSPRSIKLSDLMIRR